MKNATIILCLVIAILLSVIAWMVFSNNQSNPISQMTGSKTDKPVAVDTCGIPLGLKDTDFQVLATGTYGGISGHTGDEFYVNVEPSDKPVVLLLSGYESIQWHIQLPPKHNVKAIAITGYYRQRAIVSDPSVPVAIATYEQKSTCYTDLFRDDKLQKANTVSHQFYQKPISMFYPPNTEGMATIAGIDSITPPAPKKVAQPTPPSTPPIDNAEPPKLAPDKEGIQQALGLGLIRVATPRDIEMYAEAYEKYASPLGDTLSLPPIYGGQNRQPKPEAILRNKTGYVILKNMRMPEGMGGANAVAFILPPNVPYPKGELGHSILLNMNDGSCNAVASMLCDND